MFTPNISGLSFCKTNALWAFVSLFAFFSLFVTFGMEMLLGSL